MDQFAEHTRWIAHIREEMRFEIAALEGRINALISAEAFLTIAFTMALGNRDAGWNASFGLVAPMLSLIGFVLAALCWPGVHSGVGIINEWNAMLMAALEEAPEPTRRMWRPSVFGKGARRSQMAHRRGMVFARAVPIVFMAAWAVFGVVALRSI